MDSFLSILFYVRGGNKTRVVSVIFLVVQGSKVSKAVQRESTLAIMAARGDVDLVGAVDQGTSSSRFLVIFNSC